MNAGLLKESSREKALAESMVTAPSAFAKVDARRPVLLNRTAHNPELIFNPADPFGKFDPDLSSRWFAVDSCYYCQRHRYTRVFWNQIDPSANSFKPIPGQERVKRVLDGLLRKKHGAPVKSPVIIAGGRAHPLVDAKAYGSMLWLNEILEEAVLQRSAASVEMTKYPPQM